MKPITFTRLALAIAIVVLGVPVLDRINYIAVAGSDEIVKPLEQIRVIETGDRVRVEVANGRRVTYSMWTSEAPASVIVDLPGFAKGSSLQKLEVNKPPLLQVIPTEVTKPHAGVQLAFLLTSFVKPDIRSEEDKLVIEFPKSQATAETGSVTKESSEELSGAHQTNVSSENAAHQSVAAKVMSKVEIQRSEGEATILILGDGEFAYDARALNRDRLIVDLPHVASPLKFQVLPVDHPLLKQIRIGHHSDRVRLVFDLAKPVQYTVQSGAKQLAVRLTPASEGDPSVSAALKGGPLGEQAGMDQEDKRVRIVKAAHVPFPERLAQIQSRPSFAQMAPDVKEPVEPGDTIIGSQRYAGRRISLDFQQADIQNVFRLIAEVSGFNLIIGESVKAKVTMRLINVPWDQALDMLLKMNNLGKIREGNIIWIDTLQNIARQQNEEAAAKESKVKAEELVTRVIYIRNVPAGEIQSTLRQYLSPRGQLNLNAGGNALVIQDTSSRVAAFKELVDLLDVEVPQIQIEARIVQADTSYSRALGIQWGVKNTDIDQNKFGIFGNLQGGFAPQADGGSAFGTGSRTFLVNLPAAVTGLSSVPGVGFSFGKLADGFALDARLSAGEVLGLTKVIAAPKISTLDKREAKISQGESIPFQTTSLQGTQTTFVDANLELQVTPQITSRDPNDPQKQILMKIRATRNAVGARSNPAGPSIDKREATTQVLVRDGETAVIAGIFVDTQQNNVAGTPYLSRIPVLGWLFKNKAETVSKQELLIFLTPFILKS